MKQRKPQTKLELITHPVRLRIVMALANTERTPQQIAAILDDVPPSSIYRHLELLQDGGLIDVVAERKIRGAVEKTLRLAQGGGHLGPDDLAQMSADALERMFMVFTSQLWSEWARYLNQPDRDWVADMVGFRATTFFATDAEWLDALQTINTTLQPLLEPNADRSPRRLATITFPALDEPEKEQ